MSNRASRMMCLAVALGFMGCAKSQQKAPMTQAAGDLAAAEPSIGHDDLDAWEEELAQMEARLLASGVALDPRLRAEADLDGDGARDLGKANDAEPMADDDDARCQRVCELSEATCDLQDKICTLADAHEGEPRYASACERADDHCRRASEACRACSD
jgi:hypothetical protein